MPKSTTIHKQIAPQRLEQLRAMLRDQRAIRLDEACEALSVSQATVRRDLEVLERLGEAKRVHGGAVLLGRRWEESGFDDKATQAQDEKRRIAEAAAMLVQAGDTLFLDGGSTVHGLLPLLRKRGDITIVTNSLRAATELVDGGPTTIFIGGELRRISQTMVGPLTERQLANMHFDRAFMGTLGLTLREGMTTTDAGESFTKKLVMVQSKQVVLMVDSTKVGRTMFVQAGTLADVDVLITDNGTDADFISQLDEYDLQVQSV